MKKIFVTILLCLVIVSMTAGSPVKPTFTTGLMSDGTPLAGTIKTGFTLVTTGTPDSMHVLTLNNPVATPPLKDGLYPFYLVADLHQQINLIIYFSNKSWWIPNQDWQTQIIKEIEGATPFFYLKADAGAYSLVDGFKYALGLGPQSPIPYPLTIDDDYLVGKYCYIGKLQPKNSALPYLVEIDLKVTR
jgi:hypothetical protein